MRVVVHDYSGHPGQVHLSRELARRGHDVEHQFCSSYVTGRGAIERRPDDPRTFRVQPVALTKEFARYSPLVRLLQELQYARAAAKAIRVARPHVVVLSNVPLLAMLLLTSVLRLHRLPYVFWHQDVYSNAISVIARQRLGRTGAAVGWLAQRAERRVARSAAAVVPISDSFLGQLSDWGVDDANVTVVPNWAAIDEVDMRPKDNHWSRAHGLADVPVLLYAGTLGLKHDPVLFADLARAVLPQARVVVVSEGRGRQWLEEQAVSDLVLLDYQAYEDLPDVLASADVLLVVLESDASKYSVPSKVLNYLCAGRAVLAVMPADNAAAETLRQSGAGVVIAPGNGEAAVAEAVRLLANPKECSERGLAGRAYAEVTFDVVAVGEIFERVLHDAKPRAE